MMDESKGDKIILPHHEQQELCTTRLPYRQGHQLTAVKVYTINDESKHLLIFGVPSLNLRQETKALLTKYGKLDKFNISSDHPNEQFTETYHAVYERIPAARIAKKMLDTKNFYGGHLHICYAPELETLQETREKLLKRQKDVTFRLRALKNETVPPKTEIPIEAEPQAEPQAVSAPKLNMANINTICIGKQMRDVVKKKMKRKADKPIIVVTKKPCMPEKDIAGVSKDVAKTVDKDIEVIDFTSVENEVITNIDDTLNYSNFGNEVVKKVPRKPVNKIQIHFKNKS